MLYYQLINSPSNIQNLVICHFLFISFHFPYLAYTLGQSHIVPLPCLQNTTNSSLYCSVSGIVCTALLNAHEINTSWNAVESVVLNKGPSTVSQIAIKFLMLNVFIYISLPRTGFDLLGSILALKSSKKKFIKPKGELLNSIHGKEIQNKWILTTSLFCHLMSNHLSQ